MSLPVLNGILHTNMMSTNILTKKTIVSLISFSLLTLKTFVIFFVLESVLRKSDTIAKVAIIYGSFMFTTLLPAISKTAVTSPSMTFN